MHYLPVFEAIKCPVGTVVVNFPFLSRPHSFVKPLASRTVHFFVHVKNDFKYSKALVGSYMLVSTVVEIKENNKLFCQHR